MTAHRKPLLRLDWHLVGLAVLLAAAAATRLHSYLLFHALVELFLITVALTAFSLTWNLRRQIDNPVLLMWGMALGPVAVLDMVHMLAFKGMGVFGPDPNLATQLWVAQRSLDAVAMTAAVLLGGRRVPAQLSLSLLSLAALGLGLAIFAGVFPDCYIVGRGLTPFKLAAEYAIMAALALTLWRLWVLRPMFPPALFRLMVAACALSLLEEAAFTLYVDVYGLFNMVGHLVAVAAGALIYAGVVRYGLSHPQRVLYGRLQELNERLTDAALRDNERAALALETLDAGAWEWDTLSPVRALSLRHAAWLGLDVDQLATVELWRARVLPEDLPAFDAVLLPRPPGPVVRAEYRLRRADGTIAWFSAASRCFADGEGLRMVGLDRDISSRKQADLERQRLADDVRRFSEILAHHLQEPARLQACYAQVLRRQLPKPCPPETDEALKVVEDGANYLRRLLRDAHLYIVLDRLPRPDRPVDTAAVLTSVWAGLKPLADSCGARLEVGDLPRVWLAEARLADLFGILLGNALEYRDPDRPPHIVVSAREDGGEIELAVGDNGIGILPRYHEQIFVPFERLHTQAQHPGTGIGLALARKIVENAGGRIWVASEAGQGATFHIALPHRGAS
jgi:signal transduction histidine kinase